MSDSEDMSLENISIGDAVSARDDGESIEDEGLYYIPERRPSLDLGPAPMDTSQWHFVEQALPPAQSYESLASEDQKEKEDEGGFSTSVQLERADSFSSCYSIDSNDCETIIPRENSKDRKKPSNTLELIQDPDEIKHPSLDLKFTFKVLCDTLSKLDSGDVSAFKCRLWAYYPQPFSNSQSMDIVDIVDKLLETFSCERAVQITRTILVDQNRKKISESLLMSCIKNEVRYELRGSLKKKFSEEMITEGEKMPLDDIYTNLCLWSSSDNGPNVEHEVMNIKSLSVKKKPAKQLTLLEFLSPEMMKKIHPRMLFMLGVAGSGKSTFVRKLILDWAMERSHQHFSFIFPMTLREFNKFDGSDISVEDIICTLYPETKKLKANGLSYEEKDTLFIFDGLEEYAGKITFSRTMIHSDPSDPTSLHINLINILRGRLISCFCLITCRPDVQPFVPRDAHFDELEIHGFCPSDREEYFKKRFPDPDQAATVIEYVKSLKTLHIMCHLPLFCTLVADECQHIFREKGTGAKLPRSITYMYTKLMLKLMRELRKTRAPDLSPEDELKFLMELGQVAFTMLEKGQFLMLQEKWPKSISREAVVLSGLCTQFQVNSSFIFYDDVMSFIHPTVQEYLAALYAYLSSRNLEKNVFDQHGKSKFKMSTKGHKIMEVYKVAIDKSLQCEDGKLDMFLRFLFGFTCKANQDLLHPFLKSPSKSGDITKDCVSLIKKTKEPQNPDRKSNLQWCLEELNM